MRAHVAHVHPTIFNLQDREEEARYGAPPIMGRSFGGGRGGFGGPPRGGFGGHRGGFGGPPAWGGPPGYGGGYGGAPGYGGGFGGGGGAGAAPGCQLYVGNVSITRWD